MNKNVTLVLSIVLIFAGTLSRLLPHPLNFTPIAAIALFGGTYLNKKYSIVLPMLALLISDYLLGFYSGMIWIYGSFALIGLIGIWLKNNKSVPMIFGGTLLSSILFLQLLIFLFGLMVRFIQNMGWFNCMLCCCNSIFQKYNCRRLFL